MTLAEFIVRNMELILAEWEKFARSIPAAEGMDTKALRDHAEKMLKAFARDLVQFQSAEQQAAKSKGRAPEPLCKDDTAATSHGTDRFAEGFDLKALVSEYRALRATVTRLWTPEVSSEDRETQLSRFNEAVDQALHESVVRYSDEVNRARELFLGVIGHDLRNPLGAILNSAQYLLQSDGLSGEQIKATAVVQRSATRIQKMLSDLLVLLVRDWAASCPSSPSQWTSPAPANTSPKRRMHFTQTAQLSSPLRAIVAGHGTKSASISFYRTWWRTLYGMEPPKSR